MLAPTARPNSRMPIPCSGRHIRSLAMAAYASRRGRFIVLTRCVGLLAVFAATAISASVPAYAGQVLITEEEAKLPPPRGAVATDRRGITRGPKVEFVADSAS